MLSIAKYVFIITSVPLAVDCSCFLCKDHRLSEFDGKAVTDFQLASYLHVEMVGLCSQRCSEDHRCRSYRCNTRTRTCSTYGCGYTMPTKTLNNVTEDDGSRLYPFCGRASFGTKCDTSSNCSFGNSTCMDGVCGCVPGTSYDVTAGDCLIRCAAYGRDFSTYAESAVAWCNHKRITTSTLHGCIAACTSETGFVCINAEYEHDSGLCSLCDKPVLELPEGDLYYGTSAGWSLAMRHCAP